MPPPETQRPLLGASTFVRRGESVLLVRRGKAPLRDTWAFPGGLVEFGESLAEAAAREVLEETGMTVAIGEAIDRAEIILRDESGAAVRHYVRGVFAGAGRAGVRVAGDDAAEARWVELGDLPRFPKTPDTERIILRFLEGPLAGRPHPSPSGSIKP